MNACSQWKIGSRQSQEQWSAFLQHLTQIQHAIEASGGPYMTGSEVSLVRIHTYPCTNCSSVLLGTPPPPPPPPHPPPLRPAMPGSGGARGAHPPSPFPQPPSVPPGAPPPPPRPQTPFNSPPLILHTTLLVACCSNLLNVCCSTADWLSRSKRCWLHAALLLLQHNLGCNTAMRRCTALNQYVSLCSTVT